MLPDFLVKPAGAISTFVKANSPVILTVTSVVGVISTAVLAAKATPTALDLIADEKREQLRSEEKLTGMQSTWGYAKRVLPVYAPAIVSGTLSRQHCYLLILLARRHLMSIVMLFVKRLGRRKKK